MTKATVAKLAILIFLAFIVCLPEFFPSTVLEVQFLCAPFNPCNPKSEHDHYKRQVYEMYDNAAISHPRCEANNASNQDEVVKEWFECKTHADLWRLSDNTPSSDMDVEVIVTLQITAFLQNVTVNGRFNHSGLHIETQRNITLFGCCIQNDSTQQHKDKTAQSSSSKQNSVSRKPNTSEPGIFSAGSPDVAPSEGKNSNYMYQSNTSHCLFHVKDIQKMPSKTARWWSVSIITWLVLVLLVVILVFLGIRDQVFKNRYCCQKKVNPVLPPANQPEMFSMRRVKSLGDLPDDVSAISMEDKELFLEKTPSDYSRGHVTSYQRQVSLTSTKRFIQFFGESHKRGLSPIPELSMTDVSLGADEDDEEARSDGVITEDESEVCLEIPLTPASTHSESFTFLHHRSHLSVESCHESSPKSPGGKHIKRCPTL